MGRTGRADGWRHDQKKPLDGDSFRGQEQATGCRGDHGDVRRRERQGGSKNAGRWEASGVEMLARGGGLGPPTRSPATCWGARRGYRRDGETPEGIPPYL
jgi:hypothetical protein